jgi:hypothetical protein
MCDKVDTQNTFETVAEDGDRMCGDCVQDYNLISRPEQGMTKDDYMDKFIAMSESERNEAFDMAIFDFDRF